jgi:uroporphyrinogen decarboxylase
MNSRERVRCAINHKEPDRVPIDLGGSRVTGIHVDEYCELARYYGLDVLPPKIYDAWQMLAKPDILMSSCLKSDVIVLESPVEAFGLRNENWKIWTTLTGNDALVPGDYNPVQDTEGYLHICGRDGKPIAKMPPGGLYYDNECPTEMTDNWVFMDPEKWKQTIPLYCDEDLKVMHKRAKALYENTEFSICGTFLKGGLGTNALFAGHTVCDWMCILSAEPEYANEILRATAERGVENLKLYLEAVGEYIDTLLLSGTDYGTQRGEFFRPEIFAELHRPNYRLMTDYIHQHSDVKVMMHSCGSIYHIIPYIIDAGIDILNPIHVVTANMDPKRLKEKFGDRIVFWGGGVDTQTVLPYGTPEEVAAQTKERIDIFGPGGGFVFTPVHNVQYGVPPENLNMMINTIIEYGNYPLVRR